MQRRRHQKVALTAAFPEKEGYLSSVTITQAEEVARMSVASAFPKLSVVLQQ